MTDPDALVDPDLRAALAVLPDLSVLSLETLNDVRAILAATRPSEEIPGVQVTQISIPGAGDQPDIAALLYRPEGTALRPAILNIHGGGMVAGTAERDDASMRALAVALDAVILSIDYRLAPEAPYPAAMEDSMTSLEWLHQQASNLGIDVRRIALRGTSAGGGIATGLALLVRDRGGPEIAFLSLVYPMLDDRTEKHPVAGKYVWPIAANRFGWSSYLNGIVPVPIYAAPGRADHLAAMPPTFIAVGSIDLFIDENLRFAQALIAAGVPTELHVYPGAYHGFTLISGAGVARRFEQDSLAAFQRAFAAV